jgi:hypothetical protein
MVKLKYLFYSFINFTELVRLVSYYSFRKHHLCKLVGEYTICQRPTENDIFTQFKKKVDLVLGDKGEITHLVRCFCNIWWSIWKINAFFYQ